MKGRRVDSFDELEQAGDYYGPTDEVDAEEKPTGKRGLWFLLPIHRGDTKFDRTEPGDGLHQITEPPWTFRECEDGSIEVRESIQTYDFAGDPHWHGYLDEGHIWRTV